MGRTDWNQGDSVSKDRPISYNFMRKLSPDTKLHRGQWTSTVVISWKDRAYLPKALSDGKPFPNNILYAVAYEYPAD